MPRFGLPVFQSPFRWGLVAAIVLIIFVNSIIIVPPAPPGDPVPFWDKQLHFAAYAALAASIAYATANTTYDQWTRLLVVVGLAMTYGVAIELLQAPLPNRYFSYADILANALGAFLGLTYFAIEARVPYIPLRDLF